jgi:hypothetical protein
MTFYNFVNSLRIVRFVAIICIVVTTTIEGFVQYQSHTQTAVGATSSPRIPSSLNTNNLQRRWYTTTVVHNNNVCLCRYGSCRIRQCLLKELAATSSNKHQQVASMDLPPNEFSRTIQTDRILKTKRSSNTAGNSNFYPVSIEADQTECASLAHRFDLSAISNLCATLQLRPSILNTGGISSSSIEVEGTCKAIVIQRCVRTNEDFEVGLEFPIYCVVRPVLPNGEPDTPITGSYQDSNYDNLDSSQQKKQNNKKSYRIPDRNIDEMDVMELQRMLQSDMNTDDDTLMEDEAIYCLDGMIDVGELVAQLFWLKLDPYPKKPGTDPVQRSITG